MFSVGDKIMYGGTGVCVVQDITRICPAGSRDPREYYILKPLYQAGIVPHGTTVTRKPLAASCRKMLYFTPQSMTTTCKSPLSDQL